MPPPSPFRRAVFFEVQTQLTNHVMAVLPAAVCGLVCGLLAIVFTIMNVKAGLGWGFRGPLAPIHPSAGPLLTCGLPPLLVFWFSDSPLSNCIYSVSHRAPHLNPNPAPSFFLPLSLCTAGPLPSGENTGTIFLPLISPHPEP